MDKTLDALDVLAASAPREIRKVIRRLPFASGIPSYAVRILALRDAIGAIGLLVPCGVLAHGGERLGDRGAALARDDTGSSDARAP